MAGWATLLSKPGVHRGGLPYLRKSGGIQFVAPQRTANQARMLLRIRASPREGGGEDERSSNTGSGGGDSIFTVCLRACRAVLKWNKFRTPQRYVKTGVTGEEGQSERRSGNHSH